MTKEDRDQLLKYLYVSSPYGCKDKELLHKDICGRLPYGLMGLVHNASGNDYNISITGGDIDLLLQHFINIKPYLRSMDSMTEEERKEYKHLVAFSGSPDGAANFIDWLNVHHFDYRSLIEKGLALEAPDGMYNITK